MTLLVILEFVAALAAGTMGGLFYAFSFSVMGALAQLPAKNGAAAMRTINRLILSWHFLALFLGTPVLAAVIAAMAAVGWSAAGSFCALLGSIVYIAGIFVLTMVYHVPRNNLLERSDPNDPDTDAMWRRYVAEWTAMNHARAAAGIAAAGLFIAAIWLQAGGV